MPAAAGLAAWLRREDEDDFDFLSEADRAKSFASRMKRSGGWPSVLARRVCMGLAPNAPLQHIPTPAPLLPSAAPTAASLSLGLLPSQARVAADAQPILRAATPSPHKM